MEELKNHEQEYRPWGNYERFTLNEATTVKLLTLVGDGALSLQIHENRDEFWKIIKGSGVIRINDTDATAHEGDTFFIPRNTKHRAIAGADGLLVLEISFGVSDENDITRLEDNYGRV